MKLKIIVLLVVILLIALGAFFFVKYQNSEKFEVELIDSSQFIVDSPLLFGLRKHDFRMETNKIAPNQTMGSLLSNLGFSPQEIEHIILASDTVFNLRSIRAGNTYHLFYNLDSTKTLDHLIYEIDKINYVHFNFLDSFQVSKLSRTVVKDTLVLSGIIKSSLWQTMTESHGNPMLAIKMADIYAWTIDFYGLQKEDSFRLIYVSNSIDSVVVGIDKILAGKFSHAGKNFYSFYYVQEGKGDYFDDLGQSLRRAFLKAPLKFSRISSKFSNSRLHPVLKIRRPHYGVDYAAPTGTPVMTIGDGKVVSVSWDGGYGRRVVVKHNSDYKTGYAHLSAYAKGLKAGDHVSQGQLIGYVGSSGLSSGPHLDFRVYKNEKPVDPLKMESPPSIPINKQNIDDFNLVKNHWISVLGN